jgi:diguanylate cyclase (GGDEF)-like protein
MWFLIIRSINEELRDYTLKPGRNTLGREAKNDIVIYDDAASRYHAEIYFDEKKNKITIQDLKSTNGTFVNGRRVHHQILQHEDQIRVGFYLIALLNSDLLSVFDPFAIQTKNIVTKELVVESIEHYGGLLHDVGQRLVNMTGLDTALGEITRLVKTMLGADECQIILSDEFDRLQEKGISTSLAQDVIEHHTAYLASPEGSSKDTSDLTPESETMLLAPVMIEDKVAALIFARKNKAARPFYRSDLQFVLAVGNQVALSIQRNRVQAEMLHKSLHDSLTGLPNRTLFLDRLQQSIARNKRNPESLFAVLFFDIDNFKIVNDSLGHTTGDKLLKAIATRLEKNFREIDTIGRISAISRFGGDEFAILLDGIANIDHAIMLASRLQRLMSEPFNIVGKEIYTSISIGLALNTKKYEKPEEILRDADIAMYHAKEQGKERIEIYDTAMHNQIMERMQLVTDLKKGAVEREFRLHYQPIVSLKNGRIVGHEALLRWYKPERGILEPDMFMGLLDTGGLLYTTDGWVLRAACNQAAQWQKEFPQQPPLFMCVNISAANLKRPDLIDNVHQILRETNLDPNMLWLEVTEHVSAVTDKAAIQALKKLHESGIHISLDDFGTGYSALNYLVQFPIHALKIDRSFIQMIGVNDESLRVIETIKALADHLGLSVIAEGVDDPKQLAFLKKLGCDYVQGFLLAHPLDAEAAAINFTRQPIF